MSATAKFFWQLLLVNACFLLVRIFRVSLFYLIANFLFFSFIFVVVYAKLVQTQEKGKQPKHQYLSRTAIMNVVSFVIAPLQTVQRIVDGGTIMQNIFVFILLAGFAYLGTFISSITYAIFFTNLYIVVTFLKSHSGFRGIYNLFGKVLGKMFDINIDISDPELFEREVDRQSTG